MTAVRDFSGKVVLITGSSSGIGAATAEEFARAGAQVVITGRSAENLADVGKKCATASPKGLKPLEVVADVSKDEDRKRLIDETIKKFDRLDVLVNNAGRGGMASVADEKNLTVFDELMNLNLKSVIHLTQLSAKHLEKTKGNIINISSCLGFKPMSQMSIYCASKAALDMFTKCTALELAPKGIRVNIVNPAVVRTNFGVAMGIPKQHFDAMVDQQAKDYPLGRVGESKDISNVILFLASDECSWVTGINFVSDGGISNK